jgi:membrane fusion protein, multidrug efflux system
MRNYACLQERMTELTHSAESEKKDPGHKPGFIRFFFLLLLGGAILYGLWYFAESTKKLPEPKKEREVPVTVALATTASVPVEIKSIGNVLPFSVVNVIPQASGMLKKVCFKQGQFVKVGDPLFMIDPGPYRASLLQASGNVSKDIANIKQAEAALSRDLAQVGQIEANLAKDQATADMAAVQSERYAQLLKQGAVSKEQSDQMNTNLAVARATLEADRKQIDNAKSVVEADKAAIQTAMGQKEADEGAKDTAKIQLGWTTIFSPINGRTGSLNVYEGNVVTAQSNTPLVSIAQVKPIYVTFTVPEQYLDQVRSAMKEKTLRIQADIEGVRANAVQGEVSFIENTVNTTTGTVVMRAAFDNDDHRLFPGQFVDVTVTIPSRQDTVVVPNTALQTTQQGTAVFVVDPATNKVSLAPVELLRTTADFAAIGKGIKSGDVIVTDGQLQLGPGVKVKIVKGARAGSGD